MTAPAIITDDPSVNLAIVYNPLDLSSRENAQLVWQDGRTLAEYLDGLPEDDDLEWIITANGRIVEKDQWSAITLNPEDYLILTPVPHGGGGGGGGGGKSVMKMVALIAIAVVAAVVAGPLVAAMAGVEIGAAGAVASVGAAWGSTTLATAAIGLVGGVIPTTGTPATNINFPTGA
jgi:hypothetical protein